MLKVIWIIPPLILVLASPSCGPDSYRLPVHPTSGKVLFKGEPTPGAIIGFHPVDPRTTEVPKGEGQEIGNPIAYVGPEGKFVLSTYVADDGIPPGEYKVTVVWNGGGGARPKEKGKEPEEGAAKAADAANPYQGGDEGQPQQAARRPADRLKGKYSDPAKTPLKAAIKEGKNELLFELD